jgi:hypothetical protein
MDTEEALVIMDSIERKLAKNTPYSGNTFFFEGIREYVTLPRYRLYVNYPVNNIFLFAKALSEIPGTEFANPFNRLPRETIEKIEQGTTKISGSFLYKNQTKWTLNDGKTLDSFDDWIIFQYDNPVLERFYIGYQEGKILFDIDQTDVLIKLWEAKSRDFLLDSDRDGLRKLFHSPITKKLNNSRDVFASLSGIYSSLISDIRHIEPLDIISSKVYAPGMEETFDIIGYRDRYSPSNEAREIADNTGNCIKVII